MLLLLLYMSCVFFLILVIYFDLFFLVFSTAAQQWQWRLLGWHAGWWFFVVSRYNIYTVYWQYACLIKQNNNNCNISGFKGMCIYIISKLYNTVYIYTLYIYHLYSLLIFICHFCLLIIIYSVRHSNVVHCHL